MTGIVANTPAAMDWIEANVDWLEDNAESVFDGSIWGDEGYLQTIVEEMERDGLEEGKDFCKWEGGGMT